MTLAKKSDSSQNICEVIKEEEIYIARSNVLVQGNYIDLVNLAVSVVISSGNYMFAQFLMILSPELHKWLCPMNSTLDKNYL